MHETADGQVTMGAESPSGGATLAPRDAQVGSAESLVDAHPEAGRSRWPIIVCFALYTVLAVLAFGLTTPPGSAQMAGPGGADQVAEIWWLAWAQFALAHGHNLFFSNWQNYPTGLNAVVNTSMLGLGVLVSPITSAFGPIVAWNVLERAAFVLSATSMCLVMRRWTEWWPAAFVAGLLYGFST